MNKLTIPAILVATVMVAGIFAFMPVQQASTVHTTIIASALKGGLAVTYSLDGVVGDGATAVNQVLIDSTNIGNIDEGHFAAVLPNADDTCNAGDNPPANMQLLVGQAGVELNDDVLAATNTGLTAGPDVTFGGATVAMCIFHGSFDDVADTDNDLITDVVFVMNTNDAMPDNSQITVAVDLLDTES